MRDGGEAIWCLIVVVCFVALAIHALLNLPSHIN